MGQGLGLKARFLAVGLLAAGSLSTSAFAADLEVEATPKASAGQFWVEGDYLVWSVKGDQPPALVSNGTLGASGTVVLFGDADVNNRWRSGAQIKAGYWFDPQHDWGIEGSVFGLQDASTSFNAASNGSSVLARPFFDVLNGAQDSFLIASPGVGSGQIAINETSRLWGAGFAFRKEICANCVSSVSALVGYRYLRASDDLSIVTNQQVNNPLIGQGALAITDQFGTANNFNGLDLGLTGEVRASAFSLEWLVKVALGANSSTAHINGATTITPAGGAPVTFAGGTLALATNIGNFNETRFAVLPELALKAGYQVTPHLRLHAGYDLLFWSDVVRSGSVIDTGINATQLPTFSGPGTLAGPARPLPHLDGSDFWAQGVDFGAVLTF